MHRLLIALTAAVAMLLGSAGTAATDAATARAVSRGSGGCFPDEKHWKYFWCYRI